MLAHPTNFSSSSQSISSITSISNLIQSSPKKRKREQVEDVTTTSSTSSTIIPIPPTSPSPSLSNTSFHSFPRETTSPIITSLTPSPSPVGEFRAVGGHPVGKEVMGADRRVENQGDGEERDWEGRRNSNDYHDDTHVYDGREEEDDSKIGNDRTSGGQAEASTNGQNEIHQSPSSSATTQQQLSRHSPLPSLRSLVHSGDIYLESDIVHHQSSTQNHHHHPLQGPTSTSTPFSSTPFPIQRRSPNHPSSSISRSPPLLRPSLPASRSFSNQFNLLPRLGGLESGNPSFIMTSNRNTNNQSTSSLSSSHSDLGLSIARDSNHPYHLHRESSRSRDSIGSASRGSEDSSSSVHHQSQSIYRVRPSPDPEPEATERFIRSPGRDPLPIEHQSLLQRHQRSQSDAARLPYHREDITGFQSSTRGAVTNNGIDRESSTPSVLRSKYDSQVAFGDGWSSEVPDGMSGRPSGGSRLSKKKTPWVPTLPHQLPPSLNPSSANGSSSASRLSTSPPSTHRPEHAAVLSSMHQGNESSSPNGNHLPSNPIPINYHRSTNTEAEAERPRPSSNPTLIMPAANGSRAGVFYKTPLPTIDGGARGKVFLCDEPNCGKTFKRSEHLRRHQRSLHTNTRPYECQYPGCTKRFNRSDNLIQHQRLHEIPGSSVARNQAGGGTVKRKRGREARTVFIPASDKGIRYKWIEDPNDPTKLVQDFTHAARSSAHARQTFDSEDQGIGGVPSDRPQSLLQLQREQVQAASSNRPPQPSFLMEPPLPPDHRASRQRRGAQSPPRSRPPSTRSRRSADEEQKGEEEEASDEEVNKPKENFLLPMDDDDDDEEIELDLDEEVTRGYPVSNGVIRVGSRGENQVELQPYYPSLPNENQNGNEGDQDEMTFDDEDEDDGNGDEGMENDRQISADHAPQEEEEDPNINIQDGDGEVNGNSPVLDGSDEIAADGEVDGSQVTGKRRRISRRKSAEIQVSTRSTRSRTSRR